MELHGPGIMVKNVPAGTIVAPPPIHKYGHPCDVAGRRGEQETDWARNLGEVQECYGKGSTFVQAYIRVKDRLLYK